MSRSERARHGDDETLLGDKVRIKVAPHRGTRGIVADITEDTLLVRLDSGEALSISPNNVTNFSRAARRAWRAAPERAVGRPKSPEAARKKAITIRVDAEVWDRLGQAMAQGLIPSREQAVNAWVRERLAALLNRQAPDTDVEEQGE